MIILYDPLNGTPKALRFECRDQGLRTTFVLLSDIVAVDLNEKQDGIRLHYNGTWVSPTIDDQALKALECETVEAACACILGLWTLAHGMIAA